MKRGVFPKLPPGATGAARFVFGVFGFIFGGIGLTVLIFLWGTPFDEFGSPPLVFRIFGSFIAIGFVAFGGTMAFAALRGPSFMAPLVSSKDGADPPSGTPGKYRCPNCGAPLGEGADVSPMGDVKCPFCKSWFNIHSQNPAPPPT